MPRALWSGSLSFGLVNVPVRLVSATRDVDLHFRQLHDKDNTPIEVRRYCSEEDVEVPLEEVAHGFERDNGKQVVLTDEELEAAEPRKTRTIDIEEFVPFEQIDPVYFDHSYFLLPAGDSEGTRHAYRLLAEVMDDADRVALGRFVLRTKEYLVAIRVRERALTLTTMLFGDEVRPTKGIETATAKKHEPGRKQVQEAVKLIETLSADWEPSRYKDRYRQRLRKVVNRKKKGETIEAPRPEKAPAEVPDLMAALERSLAEARK
jgi:DNA end-binding protein Ku